MDTEPTLIEMREYQLSTRSNTTTYELLDDNGSILITSNGSFIKRAESWLRVEEFFDFYLRAVLVNREIAGD